MTTTIELFPSPTLLIRIIPLNVRDRLDAYLVNNEIRDIPNTIHESKRPFINPVSIALLMNQTKYIDLFTSNEKGTIVIAFLHNAYNQIESPSIIKDLFAANAMLFILLVLVSPNNEILTEYIEQAMPHDRDIQHHIGMERALLMKFVLNYVCHFKDACDELMNDQVSRKEYFDTCMFFYSRLYKVLEDEFRMRLAITESVIGHIPSYFRETIKMRIQIMSFFVNSDEIFRELHMVTFPHVFPIQKSRIDKKIRFDEWQRLSTYLPIVTDETILSPDHPIRVFIDMIYMLHAHQVHSRVANSKRKIPLVSFNEIIQQVVVFHFENWEEIWHKMGWRRCFEMQKRLYHLKRVIKYKATPYQWNKFLITRH